METRIEFFRAKSNNWIAVFEDGLIVVEGSITDPHTFVQSNIGRVVEKNRLYGFETTAVSGLISGKLKVSKCFNGSLSDIEESMV